MLNQNYPINQNTISINNLLINTTLGTHPWETAIPQPINITINISNSLNNNLPQTNNNFTHQQIIDLVTNICQLQPSESLRSLIHSLEQAIVTAYPGILTLEISIKQPFPATNVKEIGASIVKHYHS